MWDETPFVDALFKTLHPSVQADEEKARHHLFLVVMGHGERRPCYADEAWEHLKRRPAGFIYDRPTGLFFIPSYADHERCAGCLQHARELRGPVDWEQARWDGTLPDALASDRYLSSGNGFVGSSPRLTQGSGKQVLKIGEDVVLTAQEKIWFRELDIQRD
jgi:hypothetical protein